MQNQRLTLPEDFTRSQWPSISVVIPLYGGASDIHFCLKSLDISLDLLLEVIVVDNASPDDAAEEAARWPFVTLLKNSANQGFAAACNRGYASSKGSVIIFLNSDTVAPRSALVRLIQTLIERDAGLVGPYTSVGAQVQTFFPSYTDEAGIEALANSFAVRSQADLLIPDFLMGFCYALPKIVLEQIGVFDERFGIGNFEDNDFCRRVIQAGYEIWLSGKSYIHHAGHNSFNRLFNGSDELFINLLYQNKQIYDDKWAHES